MRLTLVAGARPNFMKIAPIIHALDQAKAKGQKIYHQLVHTGQHYDDALSTYFFEDLGIPPPDRNLAAGSGTQSQQTASIMIAFEQYLLENPCDAVLVVGDVNSTLACSLVAKKLLIDVIHVEAGIRSGDRTMPEEINRIATDAISDYFFTTTAEADENLIRQGIDKARIFLVGNTMIDSLLMTREHWLRPHLLESIKGDPGYVVLTLHRPSNVDDRRILNAILDRINFSIPDLPIIFPVHPRTRKNMVGMKVHPNILLAEPMRYLEFMYLINGSRAVITDSGGIQEETTFLHKPCITLRNTTERPETVVLGTNELIGENLDKLEVVLKRMVNGEWKSGSIPALWDGKTSERIVKKLGQIYL